MKEIVIDGSYIKLDSLLKLSGLVSTGGEAKLIILEGKVKLNGEICKSRGKKIKPNDIVESENQKIMVLEK